MLAVVELRAPEDITQLLDLWSQGDERALDELVPLVYDELRRIAGRMLSRESSGLTLQTTEVVHEAFLRLVKHDRISWKNRAQFFGIAGRTMRRLLIDHARSKLYAKRGAGTVHVPLDRVGEIPLDRPRELLQLDESLHELAEIDPERVRVVELRFFAGLSLDETAAALGTSRSTVVRQWRSAKAWLSRACRKGAA